MLYILPHPQQAPYVFVLSFFPFLYVQFLHVGVFRHQGLYVSFGFFLYAFMWFLCVLTSDFDVLRHKQFLGPVLDEQQEVMKRHGDTLDYEVLGEMDVLHRSIKEALRLHPPLILLLRYTHKDFTVKTREGSEYTVPKGHVVATSPAFANRLPYIYRDPDSYDPDRFAPGREEDKAAGAFSYLSFGGGRHGCLGEPFAYLQIKTIWSHLFRNYELELVSPFPDIDWDAMVVGVKGKVMVRYKKKSLKAQ